MDEDEHLRVRAVHASGRRTFDPVSKARLIERCLQPGASVAGLALSHGVNANLLWKWVRLHREARHRQAQKERLAVARPCPPAFVAVEVEGAPGRDGAYALEPGPHSAARPSHAGGSGQLCSAARVTASLPNGVTLTLDCHDADTLAAMIGALGHVPSPR